MPGSSHRLRRRGLNHALKISASCIALALGGCAGSLGDFDTALFGSGPGSIQTGSTDTANAGASGAVVAALQEVRAVRAKQGRQAAYEASARAVAKLPKADLLLQERALLALELGRAKEAEDLLRKVAEGPTADWRTYSALGAALSAQKRHGDAVEALERALEGQPDNPTILNNLAMAHALDGRIEKAEALLKSAEAKSQSETGKVRIVQNRALLAGLAGRIKDYETIARDRLPAQDVAANASLLSARASGEASGGGASSTRVRAALPAPPERRPVGATSTAAVTAPVTVKTLALVEGKGANEVDRR